MITWKILPITISNHASMIIFWGSISDWFHSSMRIRWCQQKTLCFFYGHFQVHENYKISSCIWQPIRSQLSSATPLYGNIKCGWRVPRVKPSAEAEHEGNGRVLATYLQNYEVIWLKVKMALYSNAGTLFESTRFPGTLEGQGTFHLAKVSNWIMFTLLFDTAFKRYQSVSILHADLTCLEPPVLTATSI